MVTSIGVTSVGPAPGTAIKSLQILDLTPEWHPRNGQVRMKKNRTWYTDLMARSLSGLQAARIASQFAYWEGHFTEYWHKDVTELYLWVAKLIDAFSDWSESRSKLFFSSHCCKILRKKIKDSPRSCKGTRGDFPKNLCEMQCSVLKFSSQSNGIRGRIVRSMVVFKNYKSLISNSVFSNFSLIYQGRIQYWMKLAIDKCGKSLENAQTYNS